MRSFRLTVLIISIFGLCIVGLIYIKYSKDIVFSPEIFFTEFFKFVAITVCWTTILGFVRKNDSEKLNRLLIESLIETKIKELQNKIESNNLHEKELSSGINLICNNITLTQSHSTSSAKSFMKLSNLRQNIENDLAFNNAISCIESDIKAHKGIITDKFNYDIIINKLKYLLQCISLSQKKIFHQKK